ncbi:unnamed protein product, partial [Ectocarpus sp. 4 AP-2014]
FTDSDLARLLASTDLTAIDQPVADFMTRQPTTITAGARMSEAVHLLADRKFSELPVVDAEGHAIGLVDVTDVVARDTSDPQPAVPTPPPN